MCENAIQRIVYVFCPITGRLEGKYQNSNLSWMKIKKQKRVISLRQLFRYQHTNHRFRANAKYFSFLSLVSLYSTSDNYDEYIHVIISCPPITQIFKSAYTPFRNIILMFCYFRRFFSNTLTTQIRSCRSITIYQ